ncbi:LysR family transcriptional regulator [Nevskia soli]|uniref:LysR family transcriptional regulator n=1 Tax=Nevskia soli TaxID=418856 RepID=UPI000A00C997|nr:LysR substrate-binding domain-containing protein [Nevskia soli]
MDIKQLEYFCQVAELGSFSRASAFLDVAQPALSRQIRQLEVELRSNLFERNGRGVTLTAAGRRLLEHSRGILRQVDLARRDIGDHRDEMEGRLVLAWPPSLGRTATVPMVEAFRKDFPRVTLCLVEGLSTHILEWLAIGRVDCAVAYNAVPSPNLDLLPLSQESLYLISPRSEVEPESAGIESIDLMAIAELPLIIPGRPNNIRMLVELALASVEKKMRVVYEIESIQAIHDLVRRGHGHAVLPMNAIGNELCTWDAELQVRAIRNPPLSASLWLATSTHRPSSLLTQRTLKLIETTITAQIAERNVAIRSMMHAESRSKASP